MKDGVIAVVAGKEITKEEFENFLQNMPREQKSYLQYPGYREQFQEQFITLHMFAKEAENLGLDQTEEFKRILENTKRDILAQLAMREVVKDVDVSEEEAREFYEANPNRFRTEEMVHARHILHDDGEFLADLKGKIESGEIAFADAAKEYSSCPSGERGGDLGEFGHGQMVQEFDEAAFAAEPGKVTDPVKTQFGYHLILVEEKKESKTQSFEEIKKTLYNSMLQKKQNDAFDAKVKELKDKYVEM